MVSRLSTIPSIMGSHDGSMDLRSAPSLNAAPAIHSSILWINRSNALLQSRRKSKPPSLPVSRLNPTFFRPHTHTNSRTLARKFHPHAHKLHLPTRMPDLVPSQLLPHGIQRSAARDDVRRSARGCVDVGLGLARENRFYEYLVLLHVYVQMHTYVYTCAAF
jgi:hypothetical protein